MNTQLQNFKNKPKFTVATLKSFLKAFKNHIYIKELSTFNGSVDMVTDIQDDFKHTIFDDNKVKNSLGYQGIWLVSSGNYIKWFENDTFAGFNVYNCCGEFNVVTLKDNG